ncbi:hypothetical protein SUDANB120_05353 [Streptomyces sp. enrichment culture]|uniref:hypothetical protein n=1 Tax=Streptomyces TaxID=1883 RepID=UPI001677D313|nr:MULTISPECIES: hypothetical protein [Streptomyces]MBD3578785.1 hypothetical protein [Streptomyces sp. KD18]GGS80709.1 hypothetical protein GCM10010286_01530 [Streptomyces toxytricini]
MNESGEEEDNGGQVPRGANDNAEMLWHAGIAVFLVAWVLFLVLILADSGPVCGTGQDKGPC